ncbi:hypothetical protein FV232_00865 [Methylobacterium sp. WL30]|uniref:phage adaptor protein n=1 Tax=unclassified Methylobacterium TaxID=2615210 RepID=UPI0011C9A861|nr:MULTISPECIES: hypothetical protein [unclassified Methylobacterium]TXN32545.1 hypothetical protein FV225_19675 [Methylobacterium sp. WL93]TXN52281.1 hypothetical protein FV227_04305 [Methylobacterium sp. WL119]TXN70636.1 hypothetical protein FV232_00865 [Methylobacterium sp. WL30]
MTASTLGDLVVEIMDDLDRPDLEPQIRRGIAAAVRHFQPERFAFNERILTFQTIPGADVYGKGDAPAIPGLYAIGSVVLVDGDQVCDLNRVAETWVESADQPASEAQPCAYSYFDSTLRLWPVPCDAWTIRLSAHVKLDIPAEDDTPSAWFDEARDMISARAKWHLALHVLKDAGLAAAMQVAFTEAFGTLRARANGIASTGQIQAWNL